jgi:two-component system, OmpR family, phosphate regulon sensor histidine kinase PhoR
MPLREWLKPPKSLLLILFLLTLVSISAVAWFGWKLLELERVVDAQRAQERLEQAADQVAATLRGTLAETGDRLSAWAATPPGDGKPEQGLLLILADNTLSAFPPERLLYRPSQSPDPEAPSSVFAEGEALEFLQGKPREAAEWYRELTDSSAATVRAGALMRLARVQRRLGNQEESRAAYARLAEIAGARVAGAPAQLVGRHALCELSGHKSEATTLKRDLLRGRWHLSRGQFDFYLSEAARLSGNEDPPSAQSVALAEAAAVVWEDRNRESGMRGQRTLRVNGDAYFLIWRTVSGRRAVLVTQPQSILKQVLAGEQVFCAAADSDGRIIAGHKDAAGRAAVRAAVENQLPWTLYFTGTTKLGESAMLARQRLLLLGILVMVLFLVSGTYFIARAIRREMEVSRLQSDFVAAVSHEFRTPLTSVRQLSEILALGRVPTDDRRQVYYETLVGETGRLQRLVETLLNFGRMEAGARQYRFEEMDAATLVERVVKEFEPQMAGSGRQIDVSGTTANHKIEADPEALSVALRNLVDNALKYSPNHPTVWIEVASESQFVAIRVRDKGAGIAPSERKAIFQKFVRGSAAVSGNVKGTGVGLAMVRRIVAAHGGEIRMTSELGQGSTFTMLLPAMERIWRAS